MSQNKPDIKITKERQKGLIPLTALDEITKSGKVSKRLVRQDTKEIAIMFARLNRVGDENGMAITHCSDLLGVPYTLLRDWLNEDSTLRVQSDKEYIARLAHRERVLLDNLFNPVDLAMQELNNRLVNSPDVFTNNELMKLVTTIGDQYMKVYSMRIQREIAQDERESVQDNTFNELKNIFDTAKERLVIDVKPDNTPDAPDTID